jgi:sodium/bile acid cotransporter 7
MKRLLKGGGFVFAVVAVIALAIAFPAEGTFGDVLTGVTAVAIAVLFVLYGTRLAPSEAWDGLRHWRLHVLVVGATFVAFPLIGLAAKGLVPSILTPDLYTGVLYLCLVPSTLQSSITFVSIARGNVPAAMVTASLSNMLGVVLTPLLVFLLIHPGRAPNVDGSALLNIAVLLLLPFAIGQLLRPRIGDWVERNARVTSVFDRVTILLVVYSAFSFGVAQHVFSGVSPWRVVEMVAVCAVLLAAMLAVTYGISRLAGLSRADMTVVVFCGSKKSLGSGLPMALLLFGVDKVGLIMLPLMLYHQIQLVVCAWIAGRMSHDEQADGAPAAAET